MSEATSQAWEKWPESLWGHHSGGFSSPLDRESVQKALVLPGTASVLGARGSGEKPGLNGQELLPAGLELTAWPVGGRAR